jgi:hypothetical protein
VRLRHFFVLLALAFGVDFLRDASNASVFARLYQFSK